MQRSTTCRCAACASIGTLDLKFIVHFGSYVLSLDGDREDLAGPDVILVHRLLKNTVAEGGPEAYVFLTAPCLERLPPSVDLPPHNESYESFGETTGGVHDLKPVIARMRDARRVYVGTEDADVELSFGDFRYPPAVVWQYFVDPEKRLRWQPLQTAIKNQPNQDGRFGPGASSHCAHGRQGTRCASTSTGARTCTSPTGSRRWVAGRSSSPWSRRSSSSRPTPERGPLPVPARGLRLTDAPEVPDPSLRRSEDVDPIRRDPGQDPRRGRRDTAVGLGRHLCRPRSGSHCPQRPSLRCWMLFAVGWIRWKRESRRLARAEKRFVTSGAHSHVGTSLFLAGVAALAVIAWLLASTPARPQLVDVADPPAATRSALDEWPSMTEPDAAATPSRDASPATTSANRSSPTPDGDPEPGAIHGRLSADEHRTRDS